MLGGGLFLAIENLLRASLQHPMLSQGFGQRAAASNVLSACRSNAPRSRVESGSANALSEFLDSILFEKAI